MIKHCPVCFQKDFITISLPPGVLKLAQAMANTDGIPVSQWITRLIKRLIAEERLVPLDAKIPDVLLDAAVKAARRNGESLDQWVSRAIKSGLEDDALLRNGAGE